VQIATTPAARAMLDPCALRMKGGDCMGGWYIDDVAGRANWSGRTWVEKA
jgi:hypothetical protein